jgi:biopolymer transport protein TolQ
LSHLPFSIAYLQGMNIWEMVLNAQPLPLAVLVFLVALSLFSWAVIFSKWKLFAHARQANAKFLRAFRKADDLNTIVVAVEQFRPAPLVSVFEFGFEEVTRQVKSKGMLRNRMSLERTLQLGVSEELSKLERNMNWLATVATVSPFIGLFGTVWGIIDAFQGLGLAGSMSLRAVAPGISHALVATAMGLAAAIPAAIFYNHYATVIREIGARMEDFAMEFMNVAERDFEG